MAKTSLFVILFLLAPSQLLIAQKIISGRVGIAKTGEPLPAAHIIIKDTYKGTIANPDGEYQIQIDAFPAVLIARFLGFESKEITIYEHTESPVDFLLEESVAELGEITVSGEDPAIAIMREVIRRKQIWRASLQSYKVDAYSRQQLKNDTSIVMITESLTAFFWDKEKGSREVLKSKRQTANIDASDNFAAVSFLPNFYDDNMEVAGFDVVGITHPQALSYYTFQLVDIHSIDRQMVYEIKATGKRKLQPLFEGTIFVLGDDYALLEVKLKPNAVISFPAPVQDFNLSYSQQFSNFGGEYWLPVDVRIEGLVEVGIVGLRFPPIGFSQVARLSDYEVNIELPDTLFKKNTFSVDSTTIHSGDSLFIAEPSIIPLSREEEQAYESLDSTATLEKAFMPKGFLTRFIDFDDDDDDDVSSGSSSKERSGGRSSAKQSKFKTEFLSKLSPMARFNRVDNFYGEINYANRFANRRVSTELYGGYSTGYDELSYGAKVGWWPFSNRRYAASATYHYGTKERYNSDYFTPLMVSIPSALGYADYFDYYHSKGMKVGFGFRPKASWAANTWLYYKYEEHSPLAGKTDFKFLGINQSQRVNPAIQAGTLSALELSWAKGEDKKAMGAIGANDISINVEHSSGAIGSDWDYTRFKIDIYRRFETLYKRRFLPNTLDLRLNAGTYIGELPLQKNEALDVAHGVFTPFGVFKTKRFRPYEGASYAALNIEHNFRSVPFEMLGWRKAPKSGLGLIAFGGIGKTWIPDAQYAEFNNSGYVPAVTGEMHIEAGLSLTGIFNLFRADIAYRIDTPGFFVGIGLARFL